MTQSTEEVGTTDEIAVLRALAIEGDLNGVYKTSCRSLGSALGVSTQTMSRRLQRLDEAGLIERTTVPDGQRITITDAGQQRLRREYAQYQRVFEASEPVELTGSVTSGMGEGAHYISKDGYSRQFADKLGYTPYPGTLNIELTDASVQKRGVIDQYVGVRIDGFEAEDRTYGAAICYPSVIEHRGDRYEQSHIIEPVRTHHDDTQLELIAPTQLREYFGVEDGDTLRIVLVGGS